MNLQLARELSQINASGQLNAWRWCLYCVLQALYPLKILTQHTKSPQSKKTQKTQANLFHDLLRDVINSFAVKPEAVNAVGSVDQLPDVFSDVLGQLLEQQLRLFFRQRPHL